MRALTYYKNNEIDTIINHYLSLKDALVESNPKASASTEYKGKMYYFCSPSCQDAFEKEPHKFVKNNGDEMKHHH
jgi:YHS domain-containing protein